MTTALISGGTITAVAATSLLSTSSMASVWSIVNQIQILYLVFLIGAFIPLDVKAVIQGPSFAVNPYNFIPLSKIGFSQEVKYKFNFPLTNEMLEDTGSYSDSSLFNLYSMILSIIIVIPFHICLYFVQLILFKVDKCRL